MNYPSTICLPALERLFRQHPPESIIAIGPDAAAAVANWQATQPCVTLDCIDDVVAASGLASTGPHDVAFVAHTLERLEKPEAEQLVAALRDRHARRLFVLVPIGEGWADQRSHWSMTDLTALGLRQVAAFEHAGRILHLYRFDLYDYKLTPDWLNPRFWANPHMWDRARW